MSRLPIVVLDDDPTGSQTVHSCLLLTRWDLETLKLGLQDSSPIRFILTNTRSLPAAEAAEVTRSVCRALKQAMGELGWERALFISRSDSTLRGHYPLETDVMAAELGPFDAHFLVPAFLKEDASPATVSIIYGWRAAGCQSMRRSLPAMRCLATTTAICPSMCRKRPRGGSGPSRWCD
jgi:hypothetical protein